MQAQGDKASGELVMSGGEIIFAPELKFGGAATKSVAFAMILSDTRQL